MTGLQPHGAGEGRIAVIAGNGALPEQVVCVLRSHGQDHRIVAIKGEASETTRQAAAIELGWGEIGRLYRFLERSGCDEILLIGGISQRPDLRSFLGDFGTLRRLPKILKALIGGDDSLLKKVIGLFETEGYSVVGIKDVASELLAGAGTMGRHKPSDSNLRDLRLALTATQKLGELDIGQAAVAVGGRVVALEGAEGTDAMLERCQQLRDNGRVKGRTPSGVLVKSAKPTQDLRVDLPAIGPRTVELAHKAGLAGVAVHAGNALVSERELTLSKANELGLFIYGFDLTSDI